MEESLSQGGDRGEEEEEETGVAVSLAGVREGGREEEEQRQGQVKGIIFRLLGTGGLAWHLTAHPTSTLSGSLAEMGQIITLSFSLSLSPQGPSAGREGGRRERGSYFISIKHKFTHLLSGRQKKERKLGLFVILISLLR